MLRLLGLFVDGQQWNGMEIILPVKAKTGGKFDKKKLFWDRWEASSNCQISADTDSISVPTSVFGRQGLQWPQKSRVPRFAPFLSRIRPSPEEHQKRTSYHFSSSPDEFSCYSKVSNALGLSIGLLSTLSHIWNLGFAPPMHRKLVLTNRYPSYKTVAHLITGEDLTIIFCSYLLL